MRITAVIMVLVFVLAACNVNTNGSTPQKQQNPDLSAPTVEIQNEAVVSTSESQQSGSTNGIEITSGDYWLHLFSPQDGDVVNQPSIDLNGEVPSETVLSINDDISLIQGGGKFSIPVELEEGPNVIEVVASDLSGNEISLVLTIVYEK